MLSIKRVLPNLAAMRILPTSPGTNSFSSLLKISTYSKSIKFDLEITSLTLSLTSCGLAFETWGRRS